MSKTIEIKKVHVRNLLLSFVIGFSLLYVLEHFGKFTYKASSTGYYGGKPSLVSNISGNTEVSSIYYYSYFDTKIETSGNGFDVADVNFEGSDFDKYSVKSYYYTKATIADFKYGVYFSLALFIVTLLFTNFKIKLT